MGQEVGQKVEERLGLENWVGVKWKKKRLVGYVGHGAGDRLASPLSASQLRLLSRARSNGQKMLRVVLNCYLETSDYVYMHTISSHTLTPYPSHCISSSTIATVELKLIT